MEATAILKKAMADIYCQQMIVEGVIEGLPPQVRKPLSGTPDNVIDSLHEAVQLISCIIVDIENPELTPEEPLEEQEEMNGK